MSLPPDLADLRADDIDVELLEPLLRQWVDAIGLPATLRLVQRYGGVRLYVPRNATADHELAQLVGLAALRRLSELHGGEEHFAVPKAGAALRDVRDRQIRRARARQSVRQIALAFRLTERRVLQICGEAVDNSDDDQPGLFG